MILGGLGFAKTGQGSPHRAARFGRRRRRARPAGRGRLPYGPCRRHLLGVQQGKGIMEPIIGGCRPGRHGAAALFKNGSTATFMADVIDASHDAAVVVDFWAPWCGPCKQLGPALEKAVRDARGKVRLVKINVDENQELAQQMRIQSIPAVYAFKDGRPVDGFVGAVAGEPGQAVRRQARRRRRRPPIPVAEAVALAKEAVAAGDHARAANIFTQVLQHEPGNVDAIAGLARAAIAQARISPRPSSSSPRARRAGEPCRDRRGARRARAGRDRRQGRGRSSAS